MFIDHVEDSAAYRSSLITQERLEIDRHDFRLHRWGARNADKSPLITSLVNTRARIRTALGSTRKPTVFPFKQLPWERKCRDGVWERRNGISFEWWPRNANKAWLESQKKEMRKGGPQGNAEAHTTCFSSGHRSLKGSEWKTKQPLGSERPTETLPSAVPRTAQRCWGMWFGETPNRDKKEIPDNWPTAGRNRCFIENSNFQKV